MGGKVVLEAWFEAYHIIVTKCLKSDLVSTYFDVKVYNKLGDRVDELITSTWHEVMLNIDYWQKKSETYDLL